MQKVFECSVDVTNFHPFSNYLHIQNVSSSRHDIDVQRAKKVKSRKKLSTNCILYSVNLLKDPFKIGIVH